MALYTPTIGQAPQGLMTFTAPSLPFLEEIMRCPTVSHVRATPKGPHLTSSLVCDSSSVFFNDTVLKRNIRETDGSVQPKTMMIFKHQDLPQ